MNISNAVGEYFNSYTHLLYLLGAVCLIALFVFVRIGFLMSKSVGPETPQWRSRRGIGNLVWGGVLAGVGAMCVYHHFIPSAFVNQFTTFPGTEPYQLAIGAILVVVGAVVFIWGAYLYLSSTNSISDL